MGTDYSFNDTKIDDVFIISLDGEISSSNENEFKIKLFTSIDEHNKIVLDFTKTTYLNSTGLGILAAALKKARSKNGNIYICSLNKNIRILFEITKLDTIFDIFDSFKEAVIAYNKK